VSEQGRSRGSLLYWVVVAAAAAVVVIGVVFSQRLDADPTVIDSPLIGQPVASLTLPYLETEGELDLDALRGDILVVNFWASWCLNCRVEHAALVEGARQLEGLDVTFVAINAQDSNPNAAGFLDELGRSPQTLYVDDPESRASLEFGVLGLPETFFVDRDGIIVGKVIGPVSLDLVVSTVEAIVLGEDVGVLKTGEVENRDS
jgi:cytochrome c biogenesis protein CcmG/thiol:disulfide interchange protein DsbE